MITTFSSLVVSALAVKVVGACDHDLLVNDDHLMVHQAGLVSIQAHIQSSLQERVIFGCLAGFDLPIIHHARHY